MRHLLIAAVLFSISIPTVAAQVAEDTTVLRISERSSTWRPGQRGTLPVRAHFVTTSPDNLLDSTVVREAIEAAMRAVAIEPDLEFGPFAARHETPPFVNVEVDSYVAGEVRIVAELIEEGRAWRPACGGGSTGKQYSTLGAALQITHKVRDALECALRSRGRP